MNIFQINWRFFPDIFLLVDDPTWRKEQLYLSKVAAIAAIQTFLKPYKDDPDNYQIDVIPDDECSLIYVKVKGTPQQWEIALLSIPIDGIGIHRRNF